MADKQARRLLVLMPKLILRFCKSQQQILPVVKIGKSAKLQVGDVVLAIGNPYACRFGNTELLARLVRYII